MNKERSNMTTINQTVTQSLSAAGYGQYTSVAEPVITALVNREQEIVGNLIQFAQGSDLDVNAVASALREAGLHMPEAPAPAAPAAAAAQTVGQSVDAGIATALAAIQTTLDGLVTFARRNGYSG